MFKVNNKNTRTTSMTLFWCFYGWFWTYFTHFSSISIVDFEQVNVSWDNRVSKNTQNMKSSVIRQKDESQNGCFKKAKHEMFVFRKFWRALLSWNTRFEIRPFALLPAKFSFKDFFLRKFFFVKSADKWRYISHIALKNKKSKGSSPNSASNLKRI